MSSFIPYYLFLNVGWINILIFNCSALTTSFKLVGKTTVDGRQKIFQSWKVPQKFI